MSEKPDTIPFQAAHDFAPMTLKQLRHHWDLFAFQINDVARKNGFRKFFQTNLGDGMLSLSVHDLSRSAGEILHLDLVLSIWQSDDKANYVMTVNIDPHDENGPQHAFPEITFPRTTEGMQKMINRCQAEILAAVGPEHGTAYLQEAASPKDATGRGGPVVN